MPAGPTERRGDYPHFHAITTRWMDNDLDGHVNNVVYYSFFDTVINQYLIRAGGLDIHDGPVIGLAVESMCRFHQPLAYPDPVDAGLRVRKLGRSSVRYEVGLFAARTDEPAATGHFRPCLRRAAKPAADADTRADSRRPCAPHATTFTY